MRLRLSFHPFPSSTTKHLKTRAQICSMRIEKTIKVMPATRRRFDQYQRELAAKLGREITQDELVLWLLRKPK